MSEQSWPSMTLSVPPAPALGRRVVDHLRRLIIVGDLSAGTHLVESKLSEAFGVSRGPIRDALRQLETEGLVEARRRGVFVIGLTRDDVEELYSLRQMIDAKAVALCVDQADRDLSEASDALARMRDAATAGNPEMFAEADLDFHTAFYQTSGHRRLGALWQQYRPTFATMLSLTNAEDRDLLPVYQDHVDLLDRVVAGDKPSALRLLDAHIEGSRQRLLAAYSRGRDSEGD